MRMKNKLISAVLVCAVVLSGSAMAAGPSAARQWDRGHALAAARSVSLDTAVIEIGNPATLANTEATLEKLQQLETRSDWPLPAREAALFEFTRTLAELPRAAVAPGVIEHLRNYESLTLVADADHPGTLIPLFNIRAAAAGVENGWQRWEFAGQAIDLLKADPARLVSAYLEASSRNQRSGYLDTLRQADTPDVAAVQQAALAKFRQEPELTPVVALAAVMTADVSAVRQLLSFGTGAGLSSALRQLDRRLQPAEKETLLEFAIEQAPAVNASLAIAAWWPGLRHAAGLRDLLIATLADPELGSAAALALAREPDVQTIKALQQTAQGDGLAARRAQMALAIDREQLAGGAQQ
jgi:hypothetical protein